MPEQLLNNHDAFSALIRLAKLGAKSSAGTGYDLQQQIDVADALEGRFVKGTLMFRFVCTPDEKLLMQTLLTWTASAGHTHQSCASYQLTRENVALLERAAQYKEPEERDETYDAEDVDAAAIELCEHPECFHASWTQIYTGSGDDDLNSERSVYHRAAIVDLHARNVAGTWMLSNQNLGTVDPEAPSKLHAWVINKLDAGTKA